MRIIKAKDYKDMSRKAANIISAQVITKPDCVLGLATGSTPIGTYEQLVDWNNTHLPDGTEPDSDKACSDYNKVIESVGGIDLQLLGLGHNGHIGFNEPADEFIPETHCVDLTPSTIEANKRFFASYDDVPKQAYTMGIKTIMPITPKVQASVLQLHPNVTVVADEAALSLVK